jgi:ABC-type ATPase involved in cell division
MIRLEGVSLFDGGPDGRAVLDDVHLAVTAGELVVIHGPGGSGKSLLLAVAAARRPPDQGSVWISSRSVADLQRSSLPLVHRNLAYLPADPPLLDDETVLENVMLALAVRGAEVAASETGARRALAMMGLEGCAGRRVGAVASGERKLVALARALAGAPPVLVLDDPSAGLDGDERERALGVLAAVRDHGATVLVATSDDQTAQALVARGARRVRLQAGRLHGGLPGIALLPRRPEEAPAPIARIELRRRGP